MKRPGNRSAFTLLEMILALAVGVVLMWGLFNALDMQVQQAQSGRLTLREATLARNVITTITADILNNLGPVNMFVQPNTSSSSSGTSSGSAASAGTTTAGSSASTGSSSSSMTTTDSTIYFNNGVYGTNNLLILVVSKVPRELNLTGVLGTTVNSADPTQQAADSQGAVIADGRRISYWMVNNGGTGNGLARQEVKQATSNDLNTTPPDVSDPGSCIIASEIKDIAFQYFDGVSWNDTWDGTVLGGPNADTPIGPPSAISITITFSRRGSDNNDLPDDQLPKYTHQVAIPAGNNFPQTNANQ